MKRVIKSKINSTNLKLFALCLLLSGFSSLSMASQQSWGTPDPVDGTAMASGGQISDQVGTWQDDGCSRRASVRLQGACTMTTVGTSNQNHTSNVVQNITAGSGAGCLSSNSAKIYVNVKMLPGNSANITNTHTGVTYTPLQACRVELWRDSTTYAEQLQVRTFKVQQVFDWPSVPSGSYKIGYGSETVVARTTTADATVANRVDMATIDNSIIVFTSLTPTICETTQWGSVTGKDAGDCIIQASAPVPAIYASDWATVTAQTKTWKYYWADSDGDGVLDKTDNCRDVSNANQLDTDISGIGNVCNDDLDTDGDEYEQAKDNCPQVPNPTQTNTDSAKGSKIGDLCNDNIDWDGDEIENSYDNCPKTANTNQADTGSPGVANNGIGDACDIDTDGDGILDANDNCTNNVNAGQEDSNNDGIGNVCAVDTDSDGVDNYFDNCDNMANPSQLDSNSDGQGNACEDDSDSDGVPDNSGVQQDNCPLTYNANQLDTDSDGTGDVCEMVFVTPTGAGDKSCVSWSTACSDIQTAIDKAVTLGRTEIFIAKGKYRPTATINLKAGKRLLGGFAGYELKSSLADPVANPTIISGDMSDDDTDTAVGLVEYVGNIKTTNLQTILSAAVASTAEANEIRLVGLIINASNKTGTGAGLYVSNSRVAISGAKFIANKASVNGAALHVTNGSIVTMDSVKIADNVASGNAGAMYVEGASTSVEIANSSFTGNKAAIGGAIYQVAGTSPIKVKSTTLDGNTATGNAGAIYAEGSLDVRKSTLSNNSAGVSGRAGAVMVAGAAVLTVSQSEITGNVAGSHGGALALENTGTVSITNTTFSLNDTAGRGGAIYVNNSTGAKTITNSTFYANNADLEGGAAYLNAGTATFNYTTMVANTALQNGGALKRYAGTLNLQRSLLVENTAGTVGSNIDGAITDGGYNLVGYNGINGVNGATLASTTITPLAAQADDYKQIVEATPKRSGGDGYYTKDVTVKFMPIIGGGPARDAIPAANCGTVITDARGELRPDKKAGKCDIGAYEYTVLTCQEDSQRRYDQGETYVKYCGGDVELAAGSFDRIGIWLLLTIFGYRQFQRRKAKGGV